VAQGLSCNQFLVYSATTWLLIIIHDTKKLMSIMSIPIAMRFDHHDATQDVAVNPALRQLTSDDLPLENWRYDDDDDEQ